MNELEHTLGLTLFDRIGKRLQLNDNGRALIPTARAVLDGTQSIVRWAVDCDTQVGNLRIGASTTIGNYLLPAILAGFRESLGQPANRSSDLNAMIANTTTIASHVAAFNLDLDLLEGPCHEATVMVRPWREDELVVVVAATDPLLRGRRKRTLSLQELSGATWLLREAGSGTREVINQLLTPHLSSLRLGVEFGNSEGIKRAVSSGLGITCLSRCVVEDLLRSGALVAPPTELPPLPRQFYIAVHERKRRTRGMDLLLEYLARSQRNT